MANSCKAFRVTRLALDAALTCLIVASAWALQTLSYVAGFSMNPSLSRLAQIIAFWLLLIGGVYIVWPLKNPGQTWKGMAARISLCAICWGMLSHPTFRTDQGFKAFVMRIKTDIQPASLNEFLRTQASAGLQRRKLEPAEWRLSSIRTESHLPLLVVDRDGAFLQWGSDFQIWRVALRPEHSDDVPWDGILFFCKLEK